MDTSKFALFADVAFTKNFTKSGERMGYTQPGVSHVLKTMEDEFGFPLFLRTRKGVSLTPNAETILPLIREIVALSEKLDQTVGSINGLETGHLTIAAFASISRRWLPDIIFAFKQKYPGIEIELLEGGTDEIVSWVESCQADLGFVSKNHINKLDFFPLCDDPLMAILPKDFATNNKDSISFEDLLAHPFVISAEGVDYDVHDAISAAKIKPDIHYSSTDDHTVISMVSSHLGVSILPNLVIGTARDEILSLPLEPFFSRQLGIVTNNEYRPSPAARRFIECVGETLPLILNKDPELIPFI